MNNSDLYALERRLRREMREYIREQLATLVKLQPYSRSTSDGTGDKVQGYQTEGSDEQSYDFDGRRVFPFGLRSVPPAGVDAAWLGLGGESGNGIIVGAESSRFGPSNLNDGEVALYNKVSNCGTLYDQNGNIISTPGSGGTVQLGGNSHPLPLWDTFEADLKAAITTIDQALTTNCVNGAPLLTPPADVALATLKTKLGNSSYESTKAKNG